MSSVVVFIGNNQAYVASRGVPLCAALGQTVSYSKQTAFVQAHITFFNKKNVKQTLTSIWIYSQGIFQSVIELHYCRLVSTAIAVIWCAKDSHHIAVMAPVVTLILVCKKTQQLLINIWITLCIQNNLSEWDEKKNKAPPWPAGGLSKLKLGRLRGWKFLKCPAQRCNQHHGERCPSHHGHQGLTITSHTWDPETQCL